MDSETIANAIIACVQEKCPRLVQAKWAGEHLIYLYAAVPKEFVVVDLQRAEITVLNATVGSRGVALDTPVWQEAVGSLLE